MKCTDSDYTDANPDGKGCPAVSKLRKESEKRIFIVKSDYGFYVMFIICIIFIHLLVFSVPLRAPNVFFADGTIILQNPYL